MQQPYAYLNGKLIPQAELSIAVYDAGFVLGATVTEQMRTFHGKLFRLDGHLDRFAHSLEIVGLSLEYSHDDLARMANDLAGRNHALLSEGDDLGLCLFATPGPYAAMAPAGESAGPTIALHTYPLPFRAFAQDYEAGQSLVVSDVRQISPQSLPRELKCRSRMHYYLADRGARAIDPAARALLLDDDGCVLEATTANVLVYRKSEGLLSPPREKILPGISVATTLDLAEQLGLPHCERFLHVDELACADEVMLTSTSLCIVPVVKIDGQLIGDGRPGPVYRQLLAAWGELTGVDIAGQASRLSHGRV